MPYPVNILYNHSVLKALPEENADAKSVYIQQGVQSFLLSFNEGTLLFKNTSEGEFDLWHSSQKFTGELELDIVNNTPLLTLHVAIKGGYMWKAKTNWRLVMRQGEMNLIYLPYDTLVHQQNHTHEISTLDVFLSPLYLQQFSSNYPIVKTFLRSMASDKNVMLAAENAKCPDLVLDQIGSMMNCTYGKSLRRLYFNARIMDLCIYLFDKLSQKKSPFVINKDEEERILLIKELLTQNPHIRFTIQQLAKKASLNDFKLKKGFKQLTGSTIFDYHFNIRMIKARELLLSSDLSLEEIADQTGYEHVSSFIVAFRENNNITPAAFRKQSSL